MVKYNSKDLDNLSGIVVGVLRDADRRSLGTRLATQDASWPELFFFPLGCPTGSFLEHFVCLPCCAISFHFILWGISKDVKEPDGTSSEYLNFRQ